MLWLGRLLLFTYLITVIALDSFVSAAVAEVDTSSTRLTATYLQAINAISVVENDNALKSLFRRARLALADDPVLVSSYVTAESRGYMAFQEILKLLVAAESIDGALKIARLVRRAHWQSEGLLGVAQHIVLRNPSLARELLVEAELILARTDRILEERDSPDIPYTIPLRRSYAFGVRLLGQIDRLAALWRQLGAEERSAQLFDFHLSPVKDLLQSLITARQDHANQNIPLRFWLVDQTESDQIRLVDLPFPKGNAEADFQKYRAIAEKLASKADVTPEWLRLAERANLLNDNESRQKYIAAALSAAHGPPEFQRLLVAEFLIDAGLTLQAVELLMDWRSDLGNASQRDTYLARLGSTLAKIGRLPILRMVAKEIVSPVIHRSLLEDAIVIAAAAGFPEQAEELESDLRNLAERPGVNYGERLRITRSVARSRLRRGDMKGAVELSSSLNSAADQAALVRNLILTAQRSAALPKIDLLVSRLSELAENMESVPYMVVAGAAAHDAALSEARGKIHSSIWKMLSKESPSTQSGQRLRKSLSMRYLAPVLWAEEGTLSRLIDAVMDVENAEWRARHLVELALNACSIGAFGTAVQIAQTIADQNDRAFVFVGISAAIPLPRNVKVSTRAHLCGRRT